MPRPIPTRLAALPFAALALLALAALPLAAQEPDLGTDAQREAGRVLYLEKCAQCHGETGDGVGPATAYFRPAPRDFTTGTFKFRSTASGELPTDADIRRSIRDGMPYTGMPAWPNLSNQEVANLAYHIKTFADDFSGPYGVVEPVPLPEAPSYSDASAERGRVVYEENQCLDCHGNLGRGDGPSAPTLEDQWGAHIRPADLTKRWTFRGARTREDIYRTFTTGLDGSPMPSYDISPEEDKWALVDYVWSLSRDEPGYATAVFSQAVPGGVDPAQGEALFEDVPAALFPVVGQIIEPGRAFAPGVNAVEVRAVHDADRIAVLLSWHDMSAETTGENSPLLAAVEDSAAPGTVDPDTGTVYSDAVAILLPTEATGGVEKPYFMFGDRDHGVDLWFVDLARGDTPLRFVGHGSENIEPVDAGALTVTSTYDEGRWTVLFTHPRLSEEGLSFEEDTFVPIAFTIWDGFNLERGNRRGLTSWYAVHIAPLETESALVPMLAYASLTLLLGLGLVWGARRKYRNREIV